MIYALYHWWTDTPMDENGMPWYADVLGGVLDILVIVALLSAASSAPAAAATNTTTTNATLNDTAPYYVNQTTVGNQSGWFPNGSNVTLDTLGRMASRLGPFIIGTGSPIPGGTTYAGTLMMGIVMVAIVLGAYSFTPAGLEGGIVAAATVGYAMTSLGLAPSWLKLVLLMVIGVVAAIAALRVTR